MLVSRIICPKCKTATRVKSSCSKALVCTNCAALIDIEKLSILQEKARPGSSISDLSLGLKGKLFGIDLEIIGRILYEGRDEEDTWLWEEWFTVGNNKYYWIQYDGYDDTYTFFEKIIPQVAIDLKNIKSGTKVAISPDEHFTVNEAGLGRIIGLAGEIPWKAQIDELISYADGHYYQKQYSIEWSQQEIEVFRGTKIDRKTLLAAFGLTAALKKLIDKERRMIKWKLIRPILWLIILLCGIGSLISFVSGGKIYSETLVICGQQTVYSDCLSSPMPLGPIELKHQNRVYKIEVTSETVSYTNWPYLQVELLDASKQPQSAFYGDFWKQDWQEGGESGTEVNRKGEKLFRLEKSGRYFLNFTMEKTYSDTSKDTFKVMVYEDVLLARYFVILGLVSLIIDSIVGGWYVHFLED